MSSRVSRRRPFAMVTVIGRRRGDEIWRKQELSERRRGREQFGNSAINRVGSRVAWSGHILEFVVQLDVRVAEESADRGMGRIGTL